MLSPEMLKTQIAISGKGWVGGWVGHGMLSPEILKTQITISGGWIGGWVGRTWNAWTLVLPPSMHLG